MKADLFHEDSNDGVMNRYRVTFDTPGFLAVEIQAEDQDHAVELSRLAIAHHFNLSPSEINQDRVLCIEPVYRKRSLFRRKDTE